MSEETATAATTDAAKTKAPVEKVQLTITGVIADLNNGLDRKAIAKKYGLNKANATKLFADPKLQFRKVVRPIEEQFVLVDDAPDLKPIVINKKPVVAKTEATKEESAGTESKSEALPQSDAGAVQNEAAIQQAPAPVAEPVADTKGEW